jgi:mono/diheme cytochrome c family protein
MKTILISITILFLVIKGYSQTTDWVAPTEANSIKNPITSTQDGLKEAKKVYTQQCAICHGDAGNGNGIAGAALKPKPASFTSDKFSSQTDGAIFWKLTNGKPPMAAYNQMLTLEQRWQMINFIRTYKK